MNMKATSSSCVLIACVISVLFVHTGNCILSYQPEQVHIAYGDNLWEIVVTWNTLNDTNSSVVEYGINGLIIESIGNAVPFVNSGPERRQQFVHSVKLKNLQPGEKYVYHCGSDLGWSDMYFFSTPPSDPSWSPRLAVFGDLGLENAQSVPRLQKEAQRGLYDAILHVGDFGYDLDWENGEVGNEFMKKIEPIAAYVPYMTCPGNHEEQSNFSEYRGRFRMPGDHDAMLYSFDMGPVHFVSINTEAYYFLQYGLKSVVKQYNWLIEDLKKASSPANRTLRPWIVVFGHRPMYCSDDDHDDCTQHETRTRVGLPFLRAFGLEPLLHEYGVDLVIWAHEHSYERLWPVFDYQVLNGSYDRPYHNARAPVHVITGSAGCREKVDGFFTPTPGWSAFRSSDYGYMRMHAVNGSHLYLEQVSDDKDGAVIDSIWMTKDTVTPAFA